MTVDPKYKRYRERHPEKITAYSKKYWAKIKAGEKPKPDRRVASRKYYLANREKHARLMKRWRKQNPEYDTERMRIWRAKKRADEMMILGQMRILP